MDTPGLLLPNIENIEQALTLSLIGSIRPDIAGKNTICKYMYYVMGEYGRDLTFKKYNLAKRPNSYIEFI